MLALYDFYSQSFNKFIDPVFESLLESLDEIGNDDIILAEITEEQRKILYAIDALFLKAKQALATKDRELKKKMTFEFTKDLLTTLKKFTGISKIEIKISPSIGLNAAILPFYSKTLSLKIIEMNRDWPEDLQSFAKKYIDGFILFLGPDLIKTLEARELTSVLLHEFGHLYGHTKAMSLLIPRYLQLLNFVLKIGAIIGSTLTGLPIVHATLPIIIVITRSAEFLNHREEYGADNFATHYGYGNELMSTFKKFEQYDSNSSNIILEILKKALLFIKRIVTPTSHPASGKRICAMFREMVNDYKDLYPEISKETLQIAQEFRCDSTLIDKLIKPISDVVPVKEKEKENMFQKIFSKIKQIFIKKRDKR